MDISSTPHFGRSIARRKQMALSPCTLRSAFVALTACILVACKAPTASQQTPPVPETPKVVASPHLIHRFSFKSDANDSIGTLTGKLVGPASIANGTLVLKNDNPATPAYVEFSASPLPAGSHTSILIWFTSSNAGSFSRLLNLGDDNGTVANAFIYLTPHTTNGNTRIAISANLTATKTFIDAEATDDGKPHMLAVVIDGSQLHLFIDGVEPKPAADLGNNTLDKIARKDNWIGKSPFTADSPLNASIHELRFYDHAMSADEILLNFKAGADTLPPAK
jgi:hypothetical protein